MADAGAGRNPGETGVGHHRDVLAEGQVPQRGGDLVGFLHTGAHGPAADEDQHVPGLDPVLAPALDGGYGVPFPREYPRGSRFPVHAVRIDDLRIDRRALDDRSFRRQVAPGKRDRAGQSPVSRPFGRHDDVIRIDPVLLLQPLADQPPPVGRAPPVQDLSQGRTRRGEHVFVQQARLPQVQHHLRDPAGEEGDHRGMPRGTVRQHVHQPGRPAVDPFPVLHRGTAQAGGVGDGRDMQQQVGGTPEGGMDRHGILESFFGQDPLHALPFGVEPHQRPGGPARHVGPDGLARWRERAVGQRESEGLPDHLRRGRRAQELAAAARRRTGTATHVRRVFQGDLTVGVPRADRLDLARVLALFRRQRNAARHQYARQVMGSRQRDHHGGQPLVARRHADHAAARRQRPDQPPEDHGRVVAVRETVHHAGRPLRAPVAGIGAVTAEGDAAQRRQLLGGRLHEQSHLPVAGVVPQGHRRSVGRADSALGAEDQVLPAVQLAGTPPHAHVLGQGEQVAAGTFPQHVVGQRQAAFRTRRAGPDVEDGRIGMSDDGFEGQQVRGFHEYALPLPVRPVRQEAYQVSWVSAG